jgi:hypothetical protein
VSSSPTCGGSIDAGAVQSRNSNAPETERIREAMATRSDFPSREALETSLRRQFTADETWPLSRAALTALIDIGLSDEVIARELAVRPKEVAALRERYELDEAGSRPAATSSVFS